MFVVHCLFVPAQAHDYSAKSGTDVDRIAPPSIRSALVISIHKNAKVRVSNPRAIAYVHFDMPFEVT